MVSYFIFTLIFNVVHSVIFKWQLNKRKFNKIKKWLIRVLLM